HLAMQLRIASPDDQQLAQMLNRRAIERAADLIEQRLAIAAHVAPNADLDQFVRLQRDIDLMQHRGGQSVRADRDDRMKMMRLGAQRSAFERGQRRHRYSVPSSS